jgi:hypothetical protein
MGSVSPVGSGASTSVFQLPGQSSTAQNYQQIFDQLAGNFETLATPGQEGYQQAQAYQPNMFQNAATGQAAAQNIANNPYAPLAQNQANWISDFGVTNLANILNPIGMDAQQLQNIGFSPAYGQLAYQQANNPFYGQALTGAQQGANIGGQAAGIAQSQLPLISQIPGQLSGLAGNVTGLAPQAAAGIAPLQQGAQNILNTANDPRQQLYQRTLQQVQDQSNANASMYGLGSSPYGAGLANQATNNFNIDWQNQQLARQAQGLSAAQGAYGQAGSLANTAGNLYGAAGSLYGAIPGAAQGGLNLGAGATNLAAGSAGLPSSTFTAELGQETNALNQQLSAGLAGSQGAGNVLQQYTGGLGAIQNAAQLPYQTSVGQSNAAFPALNAANNLPLSAIQQAVNIGNTQYQLPENLLASAQNYLTGGQNATQLSAELGNMGANQIGGGIGSILGIGNSLFGGGSGGGGLLGGLGNLFGGGGGFSSSALGGDLAAGSFSSSIPEDLLAAGFAL